MYVYIYMYVPVEKWDETPGDNLFECMYVLQNVILLHAHARYAQLKTGLNE
jgi:hypothetical protein